MTIINRNVLFLDNAMELPYLKKFKILDMIDDDFDLYDNFKQIESKLAEVLTPREFSLLRQSAKQNLDQIIEGYKL